MRRRQNEKERCRLIGGAALVIFEYGSSALPGFDLRVDLSARSLFVHRLY